jgi:hypothetical protein
MWAASIPPGYPEYRTATTMATIVSSMGRFIIAFGIYLLLRKDSSNAAAETILPEMLRRPEE